MSHASRWIKLGLAAACLQASAASAVTLTPTLLRTHSGAAAGEGFGHVVANIGDATGDGVNDYAVGEPDATTAAGPGAGRVTVFDGATGAMRYQIDGTIPLFISPTLVHPGGRLGFSIAGVGDWDGDGRADFAVGEPAFFGPRPIPLFVGSDPGFVHVYSGATGTELLTLQGHSQQTWDNFSLGDQFGFSVAGLGDVDGDGHRDLVVGAPAGGYYDTSGPQSSWWNTGKAYVYSGNSGTELHAFEGFHDCAPGSLGPCTAQWTNFGMSVSSAGDVDGDGRDDVLVGAPWQMDQPTSPTYAGVVKLYSGATGTLLQNITANANTGHLGEFVGMVGDHNGDGKNDFVTFDQPLGGTAKELLLYSASASPSLLNAWAIPGSYETWQFDIEKASSLFDYDGDGTPDLIASSPRYDGLAGDSSGAAFVVNGTAGITYTVEGSAADLRFGTSVAGLGDLNGDGWMEFAVGEANTGDFISGDPVVGDHHAYVYTLVPPCADADGDGWGTGVVLACPNPGAVDCNDANPAVNPGAAEIPGNGIDDDCNPASPGGCTPPTTVAVDGSAMQTAAAMVPYLLPMAGLLVLRRRRA